MDVRPHTLAETDCCGELFETWTQPGVEVGEVQPTNHSVGWLARLLQPVLSLSAWLLALVD